MAYADKRHYVNLVKWPDLVRWKILDAWQAAAAEVGISPIDEFNRGVNAGSAYFHVNQRRGRRWSMADAFLHPIAHRPNLTVYTQTQALRLLMDDPGLTDGRFGRLQRGAKLLNDGATYHLLCPETGSCPHAILSLLPSGVRPGANL
jgi:hypothetical protein